MPRKVPSDDELLEQQLSGIQKALADALLDDAHILLKRLPRTAKKRADVCRLWGQYYAARQKLAESLDWYEQALTLEPTAAENYLLLSEAYLRNQRPPRAMAILEAGIKRATDPLAIYERLELVYNHFGGDPARITALIDEMLTRYAGRPEALYKKGEAAHAIQLWPTALDFFRQCLDSGYVGPQQHQLTAQALAQTGHKDGALHFYRKALKDPKTPEMLFVEVRDYLIHRVQSGDEKLIAALTWIAAKKVKDVQAATQHRFLGLSEEALQSCYQEWLDDIDLDDDYVHLAEFFKNLVIFKDDHQSYNFDAASSLKACIEKLSDGNHELERHYYQAWQAHHAGRMDVARSLFADVHTSGDATRSMLDGVEQARSMSGPQGGLQRIDAQSASDTASVLSAQLKNQKSSKVWGADVLTDRMLDLLAQEGRRSLVLVGPSAVGKSAAIHHLAWRLAHDLCPEGLKGFRLLHTSTSAVLSGAKYIGMWQQRLLELCEEGSVARRSFIYWEDIANLSVAGQVSEDRSRFLDVLLPKLERRELVLLGEMLPQQARRLFGQEPQLSLLVQQIEVEEPAAHAVVDILGNFIDDRRGNSGPSVHPEAIGEAITLTQVFMPYKALPGKALELMSSALDGFAQSVPGGKKELDADFVMRTFCKSTGVPRFVVSPEERLDRDTVRGFFEERILGQSTAVESLIDAVTMFKSRLTDPERPIRSFLFVGPTGVGKTEAARVLAQYLFGAPDRMLRLNMSEFSGHDGVTKLIGSSNAWSGRSSSFLEEVRARPFCVVLLDEIEKADASVLNLLLQLLDTAQLSDAEGKPAYFQSSIIIMTSNIGARRYTAQAIGFGEGAQADVKAAVLNDVKEFFSPEVFNRFDVKIAFEPLPQEILKTLANREIGKVLTRRGILERNVNVEVDPLVLEYILRTGYDPKYGARHLRRAVEAAVAVPLAVALSEHRPGPDSLVRINLRKGSPKADVLNPLETRTDALRGPVTTSQTNLASVSDRELARLLAAAREKIASLKQRIGYDDLASEFDALQVEMARPSFWDNSSRAQEHLQRYAEVNRTLERVHRWERTQEQIESRTSTTYERVSPNTPKWRRGRLEGLLKDLESAELEALLEGRDDASDAFLLIRSAQADAHHRDWLLSLVGVYTRWAGRRGYRVDVFGEQPDTEGGFALVMHVAGMNAYGLLKNEEGVHRMVLKPGADGESSRKKRASANCDCYLMVLADVQYPASGVSSVRVSAQGVKPQRRGWKLKLLSSKVKLTDSGTGDQVEMYTDRKTEADRRIMVDFFQSFLAHRRGEADAASRSDRGVWGSVVRTLETGTRSCVRDHRSGMVIKRTQDYLAGKIDALLLERLV